VGVRRNFWCLVAPLRPRFARPAFRDQAPKIAIPRPNSPTYYCCQQGDL
jgi:hypothetical protein